MHVVRHRVLGREKGEGYEFIISLCPTALEENQRAASRCEQFHFHEDQETPLVPETPQCNAPGY